MAANEVSSSNAAAALATGPSAPKKMITLTSSNKVFEVEEKAITLSQTIKNMIEEECVQSGILLSNVTSKILAKVIEYCYKHAAAEKQGEESDLKKWDSDFVYVDQETLFDLILATNYLNIRGLFELTCGTVADMMREKTPEQIRETFHIVNDYTPEEEEVKRENSWAFE